MGEEPFRRKFQFVAAAAVLGIAAATVPMAAALPVSVGGQALPSLAPMLARVTPALEASLREGEWEIAAWRAAPDRIAYLLAVVAPE